MTSIQTMNLNSPLLKKAVGENLFAIAAVTDRTPDSIALRADINRMLLVQLREGGGILTPKILGALAGVFNLKTDTLCLSFATDTERYEFWRQTFPSQHPKPVVAQMVTAETSHTDHKDGYVWEYEAGRISSHLSRLLTLPAVASKAPLHLGGIEASQHDLALIASGALIVSVDDLYECLNLIDKNVGCEKNPDYLKIDEFVVKWRTIPVYPEVNTDDGAAETTAPTVQPKKSVFASANHPASVPDTDLSEFKDHALFQNRGARAVKTAFGTRVVTLAKRAGKSLSWVGRTANLQSFFLPQLKNNGTGKVTISDVVAIARALEIEPHELLQGLTEELPVEDVLSEAGSDEDFAGLRVSEVTQKTDAVMPTPVSLHQPKSDTSLEAEFTTEQIELWFVNQLVETVSTALSACEHGEAELPKVVQAWQALAYITKKLLGEEVDPSVVYPKWRERMRAIQALETLREADLEAYQSLISKINTT